MESLLFQRWSFSVSVHVNLVKTERGIIKVYFLNKQISSGFLIHDIVIICFHTSNKFIQPMFEELRITPFMKNKYFNVVWLNTTVCQDNLTGSNYKDSSLRILYFRSVVKWSACSPSTPTIQVPIPLKPTVFSEILCLKKRKQIKKRPGWPTFLRLLDQCDQICLNFATMAKL